MYISSKALACPTSVILYSTLFISYHILLTYQSGCIFCIDYCNFHCFRNFIKSRHTVVCQRPRNKKDVRHTSVLFTGTQVCYLHGTAKLSAAKKTKKTCSTQVSRHTVVCQQPRKQKDMRHTSFKTHSSVSAPKKTKKDMWHTSVLFTGTAKLPSSAFCISKTTTPISTKFIYFLHIHYFTYQNCRKSLQQFLRYLFLKIV